MAVYATPADLIEFMFGEGSQEQPPNNAHKLLRKASGLMARTTRAAVYPVTHDTGLPVRVRDILAFQEATCAQAAAWAEAKVDPGSLGSNSIPRRAVSKSLGSGSVTYEKNDAADAARNELLSGEVVVGEAWDILDRAGLLSTNIQSANNGYGRAYPPRTPGTAILGDDMILGG